MNDEYRLMGLVELLQADIPENSKRTIFFEACRLLGISFSKEVLGKIEQELKSDNDDEGDDGENLELPEHCPLCCFEIKGIKRLQEQRKPNPRVVKMTLIGHFQNDCAAIETITAAISSHAVIYSLKSVRAVKKK
jgi:hypothetical protein